MVSHEAARTLAPGMSALHHPALGLHHEAARDGLGLLGLLRITPSAGAATSRMAHDLHAQPMGLLKGHSALGRHRRRRRRAS